MEKVESQYEGPERRAANEQMAEILAAIRRMEKCQAAMSARLTEHIEEEQTDLRTVTDWIRAGRMTAKTLALIGGAAVALASAWAWVHDHFTVAPK